jgi:hypothetical protein
MDHVQLILDSPLWFHLRDKEMASTLGSFMALIQHLLLCDYEMKLNLHHSQWNPLPDKVGDCV